MTKSKDYGTVFCDRLRDFRSSIPMTQKQVSLKLGVPVSTYANWEQGRTEPGISDIFNLLLCLEIEANDLFDTSI